VDRRGGDGNDVGAGAGVCNWRFHVWEDTNPEMKPFVLPQVLLLHGSGFS